jgi:hypothetical protein
LTFDYKYINLVSTSTKYLIHELDKTEFERYNNFSAPQGSIDTNSPPKD